MPADGPAATGPRVSAPGRPRQLEHAGIEVSRLHAGPTEPRRGVPGAHRRTASKAPAREPGAAEGLCMTRCGHGVRRARRGHGRRGLDARRRTGAGRAASLAFAWRGAEDRARAGAARRRARDPDPLHAAVHLPVRRRARRIDRELPAVPAAGHARARRRLRHRLLRHDAEPRPRRRALRPLPVAADLATGADRRQPDRRVGRYLLAAGLVIGLGLFMGFHAGGGPLGVVARSPW